MAEKKELQSFDFKTITMTQIKDFLDTYASQEEKDEFIATAFKDKPETIMCVVMVDDENGKQKPLMVKKPILGKDKKPTGKFKVVEKQKAVPKPGGEIKKKYSHRDAVAWFIEKYVDCPNPKAIMTNRPIKKEKAEKKPTATDIFAEYLQKAKE